MIIYTNAPKAYDYWYVTELDPDVGRFNSGIDKDNPVRKLDMPEMKVEWQCLRYQSGLYPGLTDVEWEEWIESGLAVMNMEEV